MKLRALSVMMVVAMVAGFMTNVSPARADGPPDEFPRNSVAPDGPDSLDASVEMLGEDEIAIREYAAQVGPEVATNASPIGEPATVGEELDITVANFGTGFDYDETFVVLMDGVHGIILIEKAAYDNYDPLTDEYVFPNPNGCWRTEDRISTTQLAYMLSEFDNNIYDSTANVFGEPLPRGDEGQKVWILIHNIRDGSYYDCSATSYVAGYFSASEDAENNKNMMHIDTYDWLNRTGPDSARPFLYEGTFAHEFEHLVHFDQDPDEPSWVDEGMADLAAFLAGYGHAESHLAYYMVYHPFTPLTFWGGGLEDYGASYLFQLYLFEKFGGAEFISSLVQEQANGIEGIENQLAEFGYHESFDEIFDTWAIANYLDEPNKGGGRYGYENLDIGSIDTWGYTIPYAVTNFWIGIPTIPAPFAVGSDYYGNPLAYTVHYWQFTNQAAADVYIDGDDFAGTTAYSGTYEWYSGNDVWAWRSFYQTFDLTGVTGAELEFQTFYQIETNWDYGYVEVYDHDTDTWTTLDATGTVDYVLHAQDNPFTPIGREPTTYEAAGTWHAFTGSSGGWVPVTMDLSAFDGHTIDLYFTTWQDGAYTEQMMYVDDIAIDALGFFDDVEGGSGNWATTGWYITDGILPNGLNLTVLGLKGLNFARYPEPADNSAAVLKSVHFTEADPDTQEAIARVPSTPASSGRFNVAVITNHADHLLNSYYFLIVQ